MRDRDRRVDPLKPVLLEREVAQRRRGQREREHGGTTSCRKPGSVSSSVRIAPPTRSAASTSRTRRPARGQRDRADEPVGPGADDDGVVPSASCVRPYRGAVDAAGVAPSLGNRLRRDARPARWCRRRASTRRQRAAERAEPVAHVHEAVPELGAAPCRSRRRRRAARSAASSPSPADVTVIVAPSPAYLPAFCIASRQQKYAAVSASSG